MELDAVVQLVTVLVAALAIVWHQQHNTDKLREDLNILREDFNVANHQLREDLNTANQQHREDLNTANQQHREDLNKLREDFNAANHQHREDFNKLREGITENGQRLARIEGFLGIGIPTVADESIDAGSG